MKAIVCAKYGKPGVLRLEKVAEPVPADGEVRIKVRAASVTPADCATRRAKPFMIRLLYGLTKPKYPILGVELAGEVESVGKNVKSFKAGDRVYGVSPKNLGAYAEYKCLPETAPLAVMPANLSYEEAVGACDGALTAIVFLRDVAKLRKGKKVLINGASGAVGSYAVQLAKHYGAIVTGVCSSANADLVRSLGADEVVAYDRESFERSRETYDVIFDAVGKSSFSRCKGALTSQGLYLSTAPKLTTVLQMLRTSRSKGKKAKFAAAGLMQNKQNLVYLGVLIETGALKSVIDRRYPLEKAAEAHEYVDTGRKKGNVVLVVAPSAD